MTRIIAGAAGSLPLAVPDQGTRPTSDRVRESIFGALDASGIVEGATVLDGYAGSGALGLEAVSRGAASADLVERAAKAAAVVAKNVARVSRAVPQTAIRVHRAALDGYLRARSADPGFSLVFLDPPYDLTNDDLSETLDLLTPHLHADAVVVVERATRSGSPTVPASLQITRSRKYGDTTVWWIAPTEDPAGGTDADPVESDPLGTEPANTEAVDTEAGSGS